VELVIVSRDPSALELIARPGVTAIEPTTCPPRPDKLASAAV
jgi:hypothetical protein